MILASQSPRRREMFDRLGLDYRALTSDADEHIEEALAPADYVKTLALRKAKALSSAVSEDDYVIAADTVVALDGEIYGKPVDYADAFRMISAFSGKTHEVYTAFAIVKGEKNYAEAVATAVTFRALSDQEIDYYIKKEAPYDKAGAYGIQELAGIFVEKIEGNFDNVVGLPLCQLETAMKREFGISLFSFAKT
ncbi:MAG: septum formation inhibitor Maf [Clostridia bacterium]|nr:septum formation inhibitor Maf [Clostridia bacterium]